MKSKQQNDTANKKFSRKNFKREQPRKDSKSKRINLDNERESKFLKDEQLNKAGGPKVYTDTKRGSNEISWYNRNPELLKAAGSIPFSSILGHKVLLDGSTDMSVRVPGIMVFNYEKTFGGYNGVINQREVGPYALNQCYTSMYSYIVHANSRNYNYNYADLGMLVEAGIEVFSTIALGIRAYGLLSYYREQNSYAPTSLVRALGFNYPNLRDCMSQMWFDINNLISRTKQIWIPTTMPILQRRMWMNSNVFADSPEQTAQLYMYNPSSYYFYDSKMQHGGGLRKFTAYPFKFMNWNAFVATVNTMIDKLLADEDRGIIYGDLLKAYTANNIFALSPISADYAIAPIYNPEVLSQFENLTQYSHSSTGYGQYVIAVTQDENGNMQPVIETSTNADLEKRAIDTAVLNFHMPTNPTPEQCMIATRMTSLGLVKSQNYFTATLPANDSSPLTIKNMTQPETYTFAPVTCGTEFVRSIDTWNGDNYGAWGLNMPQLATGTDFAHLSRLIAFDWHPFYYVTEGELDPGLPDDVEFGRALSAYGDYDNYTTLKANVLTKLHNVAILSLYGVPHF